jgi:hypothetical protein
MKSEIMSFKVFQRVYKYLTKGFQPMVIKNKVSSDYVYDNIMYASPIHLI